MIVAANVYLSAALSPFASSRRCQTSIIIAHALALVNIIIIAHALALVDMTTKLIRKIVIIWSFHRKKFYAIFRMAISDSILIRPMMPGRESFKYLVGNMEKISSQRVFYDRKMRPPSPDGVEVDWDTLATAQVQFMLIKSRIIERRNLKNDIGKAHSSAIVANKYKLEMPHMMPQIQDETQNKVEVSQILADMTSFI